MEHRSRRLLACLMVACGLVLSVKPAVAWGYEACGMGCICVNWRLTPGWEYIEVRCSLGIGTWVQTIPPPGTTPPDGVGSFGGNGTPQSIPTPLPGNPLTPQQLQKLDLAKPKATSKLLEVKEPDTPPGTRFATTCSALFENNPMGRKGADLLANYVIFRDGTGVKAPGTQTVVCNSDTKAWTTCCLHNRVVYLCNSFGATTNIDELAYFLIHETLHVAGQKEDLNTTVGPGNPPSSGQIQDVVRAACATPTRIE